MKLNQSAPPSLTLILSLPISTKPQRLAKLRLLKSALNKAKLKASLIVVSQESEPLRKSDWSGGLATQLSVSPLLASWPALALAAQHASTDRLLFIPDSNLLDTQSILALLSVPTESDWVGFKPAGLAPWKLPFVHLAQGSHPADLNAPCLVRREVFLEASARVVPAEFAWAIKVYGAARSISQQIQLLAKPTSSKSLSAIIDLDLNHLAARAFDNGLSLGIAFGLLRFGMYYFDKYNILSMVLGVVAIWFIAEKIAINERVQAADAP